MVKKKIRSFVTLIPMIFIIMPRGMFPYMQFLTYPLIFFICIILILIFGKKTTLNNEFKVVCTLFISFMACICISAFFGSMSAELRVFVHIFKPLFFLIIFIFGCCIGSKAYYIHINKSLLKMAYIIIVIQLIVGTTHFLGLSWFNILYYSPKTHPFGQILRITGTLYNPNIFAWIVSQMNIIIFMIESRKSIKYIFTLVGLALIFCSGSRSTLILFPMMLVCAKILFQKGTLLYIFVKLQKYLLFLLIFFVLMFNLINTYKEYFPYLGNILKVTSTGSLTSDNSFYARTLNWGRIINDINGDNNVFTWLFGMGPGAVNVADNDYLYSIANYGLIGLTINILIYLSFYKQLSKTRNKNLAVIGKVYIIFSLVIGLQGETISGWDYPVLIALYAGIASNLKMKPVTDKSLSKNIHSIA